MTLISRYRSIAALMLALSPGVALAEYESKQPFELGEVFAGTVLAFEAKEIPKGLENVVVTIDGPREFTATIRSKRQPGKIELREFGELFDGSYRYQITGVTGEAVEVNPGTDANGRDQGDRSKRRLYVSQSGTFQVKGGKIVEFKDEKEN